MHIHNLVYTYTYTCIHIHIHVYTHTHTHVHTYTYTCIHIHIHMYTHTHTHVFTYTYMAQPRAHAGFDSTFVGTPMPDNHFPLPPSSPYFQRPDQLKKLNLNVSGGEMLCYVCPVIFVPERVCIGALARAFLLELVFQRHTGVHAHRCSCRQKSF